MNKLASSRKTKKEQTEKPKKNRKKMFFLTFVSAILLLTATYAWLSSALNVKIRFFEMTVSSTSGLFISLDGVNYSDSVVISMDTVIVDLKENYPNHTNQWAYGMWPVSTNGIPDANSYKFDVYEGELLRTRAFNPNGTIKRTLNTVRTYQDEPNASNAYLGFDVFLKNVSGSPKSDNLYFANDTLIDYEKDTSDEVKEQMSGLMNSVRIALVKVGTVPLQSDLHTVQNMTCNNNCQMYIYEPNSTKHSPNSIATAENYGITLINGVYNPTYAVIKEALFLEHTNGHPGTGIPLDTEHFAEQKTITEADFDNPLFEIPNAITKVRVYVWIEGQDIDSLETLSKGAAIDITISLIKDLAGYE